MGGSQQRTSRSRGSRVRAFAVGMCLICLIWTGALAACNVVGASVHVTTATATHPPVASATATLPASGPPATLGALGQAFISTYGSPTNQSNPAQGELYFHQYAGFTTDYLIVDEGAYLGVTPGGANVGSILVTAPPGQPWTVSDAKRSCAGFAPADAQLVRTVTTSSQGGAVVGWDDLYQSASLASTFPPSAFQDASQHAAPAGSFDISYLYASSGDTAHVTSCSLALGERQTVG